MWTTQAGLRSKFQEKGELIFIACISRLSRIALWDNLLPCRVEHVKLQMQLRGQTSNFYNNTMLKHHDRVIEKDVELMT